MAAGHFTDELVEADNSTVLNNIATVLLPEFAGLSLKSLKWLDDLITKGVTTSFDDVFAYILKNGELPSNYITKAEAKALGWNPKLGNLAEVAPGKSIGGDVFYNLEGLLPKAEGRIWFEADINYLGGFRGKERLLFSNDGLFYKTVDHYKTFIQLK